MVLNGNDLNQSSEVRNNSSGRRYGKEFWTAKTITFLGLLIALDIVLTRFLSFQAWNIRIGFGFVPVVLAAMLFGALPAIIVAGAGDVVGALVFPTGPYFPGFTLTAVLTGLTFGMLLHKDRSVINTVTSVVIVQWVLGLLLNSLWISMLYGSPYMALLPTRAVQAAILSLAQFVTIRVLAQVPTRFSVKLSL